MLDRFKADFHLLDDYKIKGTRNKLLKTAQFVYFLLTAKESCQEPNGSEVTELLCYFTFKVDLTADSLILYLKLRELKGTKGWRHSKN